jgi:hypothetical protein
MLFLDGKEPSIVNVRGQKAKNYHRVRGILVKNSAKLVVIKSGSVKKLCKRNAITNFNGVVKLLLIIAKKILKSFSVNKFLNLCKYVNFL